MKPAIVLSSYTMGLGVIRALGRMGVPVTVVYYDDRDMGFVSKYVVNRVRAPHPEKAEAEFVDLLVGLADRLGGGLLIPTSDATLGTVSRNKGLLERHYVVACAEWQVAQRFIDKKLTYALAEAVGVPAPRTIVPHSVEDVERYSENVMFPCLVKPSLSHRYYAVFKQKMVRVESKDDLIAAYRRAAEADLQVVLQEFIPGDDAAGANYNSYFWDGEPLVEFTAQKVRNAPPVLGSPRVAVSKVIPEVMGHGREILRAMGFEGYSCTEFKRDPRDGVYKLMEVNGRHNLSTLLAVRCGINFPWIQYNHLINGVVPAAQSYETGVYWIDMVRDVGYSLRHLWKERYSPWQYLRPYLGPSVFGILDARDPKPFMKRCTDVVRTLSASRAGK